MSDGKSMSEEQVWESRMAGILTAEEIEHYELIKDWKVPSMRPTTYDLTMGGGHFVYGQGSKGNTRNWELYFIGSDHDMSELNSKVGKEAQYKRQDENRSNILSIPAYGAALIQLNETVDTYSAVVDYERFIVGRFDLRLGSVHKGLISQQATQVEPYYKGKLFCFIYNLSKKPIELKYKDRIATIEFSHVSRFGDEARKEAIRELKKRNDEKYKGHEYCTDNGIDDIRYFRTGTLFPDYCGLLGLKDMIYEEITKDDEFVERLVKSSSFMEKLVKMIGEKLKQ